MRLGSVLVVLMVVSSGPAWSHAFLLHANPGAGSVVATAPRTVTLEFSEALEPAFSSVTVVDSLGRDVASAPSVTKGTQMMITLRTLKPGRYRIVWHALSVDTHRTQGSFSFTVKQQ